MNANAILTVAVCVLYWQMSQRKYTLLSNLLDEWLAATSISFWSDIKYARRSIHQIGNAFDEKFWLENCDWTKNLCCTRTGRHFRYRRPKPIINRIMFNLNIIIINMYAQFCLCTQTVLQIASLVYCNFPFDFDISNPIVETIRRRPLNISFVLCQSISFRLISR